MLTLTHWLIVTAYLAAPILGVLAIILRRKRGSIARAAVVVSIAIVSGLAINVACAFASRSSISPPQVALCVYLMISLIVLLGAIDRVLLIAMVRLWTAIVGHRTSPGFRRGVIATLPLFLRAGALAAFVLPYMMSLSLTFRPKVLPRETPQSALKRNFQAVEFETSDHLTIRGWWIPATAQTREANSNRLQHRFGRDTILLCHGFGANKSAMLDLAQSMLARGYNVLVFDFRGHGESEGQLSSLGDLERRDVLAAAKFVREIYPRQSRRLLGLGISTGAAALIEAAADESPEGQSIEAIAVIEAFDDLAGVARTTAQAKFLPPMNWFADRVALMLAGAQVGADLQHFSPAHDVHKIWPRPILFIHGGSDSLIPFDHGVHLYDAAEEPKRCLWIPGADYTQTIHSKNTAKELLEFFDEAKPVPAA